MHIMKFRDPVAEQNNGDTTHHTLFLERLIPQCEEEPEYTEIIPLS